MILSGANPIQPFVVDDAPTIMARVYLLANFYTFLYTFLRNVTLIFFPVNIRQGKLVLNILNHL